tara:strand:+ start:2087 stop:3457 length:1371 start_codon:yes stop_codon:yes gene_type:complete
MAKSKILLVDDELPIIRSIIRNLEEDDYSIDYALEGEVALKMIEKNHAYDVIVCDLMMPNIDGLQILEFAKNFDQNIIFIMMTAFPSIGAGIKAMNIGAYDFLQKPFDHDHLSIIIEKGLQTRQLKSENLTLKAHMERANNPPPMIGESEEIKNIMKDVKKLSDSTLNMLVEGESGTGKELLARHIHFHSPKRHGLFMPLNCASIPSELLESELFGHEKGAFTGAFRKKIGLLEVASSGTIFLDEINNLSMELQAKLLRALQEKSFMRVGGTQEVNVNARIVAASNKNLERLVEEKKFREDLFYRLNVIVFTLPPLRNRVSDVPLLVEHFLHEIRKERTNQVDCNIDDEMVDTLKKHGWPGNIRELRNAIERIVAFYDPADSKSTRSILSNLKSRKTLSSPDFSTEMSLEQVERKHIIRILEMTSWNKSEASKILKIDYTTLYRKLKKYEIAIEQN